MRAVLQQVAGTGARPILKTPAIHGRQGADDGIPDGLLQPIPVARRLRGGRDRTGVCTTGDPRCADRDPCAADDHWGADRAARARSAAGVDLDDPGPSATIGPPDCGGPRHLKAGKTKSQAMVPWLLLSMRWSRRQESNLYLTLRRDNL